MNIQWRQFYITRLFALWMTFTFISDTYCDSAALQHGLIDTKRVSYDSKRTLQGETIPWVKNNSANIFLNNLKTNTFDSIANVNSCNPDPKRTKRCATNLRNSALQQKSQTMLKSQNVNFDGTIKSCCQIINKLIAEAYKIKNNCKCSADDAEDLTNNLRTAFPNANKNIYDDHDRNSFNTNAVNFDDGIQEELSIPNNYNEKRSSIDPLQDVSWRENIGRAGMMQNPTVNYPNYFNSTTNDSKVNNRISYVVKGNHQVDTFEGEGTLEVPEHDNNILKYYNFKWNTSTEGTTYKAIFNRNDDMKLTITESSRHSLFEAEPVKNDLDGSEVTEPIEKINNEAVLSDVVDQETNKNDNKENVNIMSSSNEIIQNQYNEGNLIGNGREDSLSSQSLANEDFNEYNVTEENSRNHEVDDEDMTGALAETHSGGGNPYNDENQVRSVPFNDVDKGNAEADSFGNLPENVTPIINNNLFVRSTVAYNENQYIMDNTTDTHELNSIEGNSKAPIDIESLQSENTPDKASKTDSPRNIDTTVQMPSNEIIHPGLGTNSNEIGDQLDKSNLLVNAEDNDTNKNCENETKAFDNNILNTNADDMQMGNIQTNENSQGDKTENTQDPDLNNQEQNDSNSNTTELSLNGNDLLSNYINNIEDINDNMFDSHPIEIVGDSQIIYDTTQNNTPNFETSFYEVLNDSNVTYPSLSNAEPVENNEIETDLEGEKNTSQLNNSMNDNATVIGSKYDTEANELTKLTPNIEIIHDDSNLYTTLSTAEMPNNNQNLQHTNPINIGKLAEFQTTMDFHVVPTESASLPVYYNINTIENLQKQLYSGSNDDRAGNKTISDTLNLNMYANNTYDTSTTSKPENSLSFSNINDDHDMMPTTIDILKSVKEINSSKMDNETGSLDLLNNIHNDADLGNNHYTTPLPFYELTLSSAHGVTSDPFGESSKTGPETNHNRITIEHITPFPGETMNSAYEDPISLITTDNGNDISLQHNAKSGVTNEPEYETPNYIKPNNFTPQEEELNRKAGDQFDGNNNVGNNENKPNLTRQQTTTSEENNSVGVPYINDKSNVDMPYDERYNDTNIIENADMYNNPAQESNFDNEKSDEFNMIGSSFTHESFDKNLNNETDDWYNDTNKGNNNGNIQQTSSNDVVTNGSYVLTSQFDSTQDTDVDNITNNDFNITKSIEDNEINYSSTEPEVDFNNVAENENNLIGIPNANVSDITQHVKLDNITEENAVSTSYTKDFNITKDTNSDNLSGDQHYKINSTQPTDDISNVITPDTSLNKILSSKVGINSFMNGKEEINQQDITNDSIEDGDIIRDTINSTTQEIGSNDSFNNYNSGVSDPYKQDFNETNLQDLIEDYYNNITEDDNSFDGVMSKENLIGAVHTSETTEIPQVIEDNKLETENGINKHESTSRPIDITGTANNISSYPAKFSDATTPGYESDNSIGNELPEGQAMNQVTLEPQYTESNDDLYKEDFIGEGYKNDFTLQNFPNGEGYASTINNTDYKLDTNGNNATSVIESDSTDEEANYPQDFEILVTSTQSPSVFLQQQSIDDINNVDSNDDKTKHSISPELIGIPIGGLIGDTNQLLSQEEFLAVFYLPVLVKLNKSLLENLPNVKIYMDNNGNTVPLNLIKTDVTSVSSMNPFYVHNSDRSKDYNENELNNRISKRMMNQADKPDRDRLYLMQESNANKNYTDRTNNFNISDFKHTENDITLQSSKDEILNNDSKLLTKLANEILNTSTDNSISRDNRHKESKIYKNNNQFKYPSSISSTNSVKELVRGKYLNKDYSATMKNNPFHDTTIRQQTRNVVHNTRHKSPGHQINNKEHNTIVDRYNTNELETDNTGTEHYHQFNSLNKLQQSKRSLNSYHRNKGYSQTHTSNEYNSKPNIIDVVYTTVKRIKHLFSH